mmetsp:Transcript_10528/g.27934  ORF Transcript_10528/g.27934 Transcript_10528/m.27934 type:complete len:362 (-) Transcript_10528:485-1570(-)
MATGAGARTHVPCSAHCRCNPSCLKLPGDHYGPGSDYYIEEVHQAIRCDNAPYLNELLDDSRVARAAAERKSRGCRTYESGRGNLYWNEWTGFPKPGWIDFFPPWEKNGGHTTWLHRACRENKPACVAVLLDRGASLEIKNHNGYNALRWTLHGRSHQPELAAYLLERGSDPNCVTNAYQGRYDTVESGGDTPLGAMMGNNSLLVGDASAEWMPRSARDLLRYGADIYLADASGRTVLDRARQAVADGEKFAANPDPMSRYIYTPNRAVGLVLTAAEPWSPSNHELFARDERRLVFELLCIRWRLRSQHPGLVTITRAPAPSPDPCVPSIPHRTRYMDQTNPNPRPITSLYIYRPQRHGEA